MPAVAGYRASEGMEQCLRPLVQGPCTEKVPRGWASSGQESSPKGQSKLRPDDEPEAAVRPEVVLGRWGGKWKRGGSEDLVQVKP